MTDPQNRAVLGGSQTSCRPCKNSMGYSLRAARRVKFRDFFCLARPHAAKFGLRLTRRRASYGLQDFRVRGFAAQ